MLKRAPLLLISGALLMMLFPALFALAAGARSHNWAGYTAQGAFTSVAGSWVVPAASGAAGAGDAEWVGIGGLTSSDLIQAGTRGLADTSGTSYAAWYELLPATAVPIALRVAPGDSMHAAIEELAPGSWRIELEDLTSGARFATTTTYASTESSAEWILEAPQMAGKDILLDDFSRAQFFDLSANGKTPAALGAASVSLVDAAGTRAAPASRTTSGFSVVRE